MVTESEMSEIVCSHYHSMGLLVKTEVPLLSKRIDIVAFDSGFDTLILVETKVSKWKSALRQASVYALCAPDVYVAISKEHSHRVDLNLVRRLGLGLLEVDGNVRPILEPSISQIPQPSVRKAVTRYLSSSLGDVS